MVSSKIRKFRLKTNHLILRQLFGPNPSKHVNVTFLYWQSACIYTLVFSSVSYHEVGFLSVYWIHLDHGLVHHTSRGVVKSPRAMHLSLTEMSLNLFQTLFQNTSTWLWREGLCFKWCHTVMTELEFLALPCVNKSLWVYHGIAEHLRFTKFTQSAAKSSPELSVYV